MAQKIYRVRNWNDYNKSLVSRGSLTFWFSPEVIQAWEKQSEARAHGNQQYSNLVITCGLTIRQLFRLPLRATEGMMRSIAGYLKLTVSTPNYSTLCRRSQHLKVNLNAQGTKKARHVLVDSTGVRVIGESEWKYFKYGVKQIKYQKWCKLHIAMDANNQDVLGATVTESERLDGNYLGELIDKIAGPIDQITGDGAYDKKHCYQVAHRRNAKAVFPPQHNACLQRNKYKKDPALAVRDETILIIGRGKDRKVRLKAWKEETGYRRRSLVETMMFRMKSIFGDEIRSRTFERQQTDLLIRCYAINQINTLGLPISESI